MHSRYIQSSGFSSEVVNTTDNQEDTIEPLKKQEDDLVVEVVEAEIADNNHDFPKGSYDIQKELELFEGNLQKGIRA
jgi:hypothetical protein